MNELEVPHYRPKHTLIALGYGAILLLWLTPEDRTVLIVCLLGAGLSLLSTLGLAARWLGGRKLHFEQWFTGLILAGALVGFNSVWATIGLMIFKNAWHAHAYPDFPGVIVVGISARIIPWTTAGALLGGAAALLRMAWISPAATSTP